MHRSRKTPPGGALALPGSVATLAAMWPHRRRQNGESRSSESTPRLKEALRKARLEQAERTSVVVDLHDAEIARLELLDDALDPLFEEVPADVDLFDRGITRGETPRLWIDSVAHVAMG